MKTDCWILSSPGDNHERRDSHKDNKSKLSIINSFVEVQVFGATEGLNIPPCD